MNSRINMYIPHKLREELDLTARKSGVTKSSIVEAALMGHFSAEHGDKRDAVFIRRLDRMTRQMDRQARDFLVISETLALFIRYYLTVMPPLAASEKQAARALGNERFENFITQLAKRLSRKAGFIHDVIEDIPKSEPDFYSFGEVTDDDLVPDPEKDKVERKHDDQA
ncbi:MAG: CopG family transcriptional regulator [Candidatus Marinimicrobia bacterium]|nr:CopG family transcriptional regulator [Candidatus Neomarinimicrobiota bacterium]